MNLIWGIGVVEGWLNLLFVKGQPTTLNRHGRCARRDNRAPCIGESPKQDEKWSWRPHHIEVSRPGAFPTLPFCFLLAWHKFFHGCLLTESDPESAWPHSTWMRWRQCRKARLAESTSVFWRTMWVFDWNHQTCKIQLELVLTLNVSPSISLSHLLSLCGSACDPWLEGRREVCGRWGACLRHAAVQRGPRFVAHTAGDAHQHAGLVRCWQLPELQAVGSVRYRSDVHSSTHTHLFFNAAWHVGPHSNRNLGQSTKKIK